MTENGVITSLQRRLLSEFQHDFPLCAHPFVSLAERLGTTEAEVLEGFRTLEASSALSRIGAVFDTQRTGASTLAAMAVPAAQLVEVTELVSSYVEVNHNYEREHHFNLWFVVTAPDECALKRILTEIEARAGFEVLALPMVEAYHIDLGFKLQWTL